MENTAAWPPVADCAMQTMRSDRKNSESATTKYLIANFPETFSYTRCSPVIQNTDGIVFMLDQCDGHL
jgi:hypothetical protein